MTEIEKEPVVAVLNKILESDLAGVVRYTHYPFLVFGFGRIPRRTRSRHHFSTASSWRTSTRTCAR